MKTNEMKKEKAITLIALIVTIIVLLILAGVSIAVLTGQNGILNRATSAQKTSEESEAQEKLQLELEALKIDYYKSATRSGTFGEYVATREADLKTALGDNTLKVGNNKITYGGYDYTLDGQGNIINRQVVVDYSQIKVGDYVNYNPMSNAATGTSYTSYSLSNASAENNSGRTSGYSSDQVFDAQKYVDAGFRWRVLDIKDETIRLISEETFGPGDFSITNKTTYYLYGEQGYINGENELKEICKIFGHGKGAESSTSITAQDILDITGYDPSATPKYDAGEWNEYGNKVTYTRGDGSALSSSATNGKSWSGSQSTFNYFNGTSFVPLTSGSKDITSTSYYHDFKADPASNNNLVDENNLFIPQYELLFGKQQFDSNYSVNGDYTGATSPSYWLASPNANPLSNYAYWGLRKVVDGSIDYGTLYDSRNFNNTNSYGVRPIVNLTSRIQLKWNPTDNEWKIQ